MAARQCDGCKAYVSLRSATSCPRCGTAFPLPGPVPPAEPNGRPAGTAGSAFALVALGLIVVLLGAIIYRVVFPSVEHLNHEKVMAALVHCQDTIHGLAEYGGADAPPYAQNYGKGNEFYFAWPQGSFEFTNGFGARVRMSASCIGNLTTGEITSLTVNGRDIVAR
jgi:hypothetical protein